LQVWLELAINFGRKNGCNVGQFVVSVYGLQGAAVVSRTIAGQGSSLNNMVHVAIAAHRSKRPVAD
jgi:hypothetical protein